MGAHDRTRGRSGKAQIEDPAGKKRCFLGPGRCGEAEGEKGGREAPGPPESRRAGV